MASVSFNLRDRKAKNNTTIYCKVRYNNKTATLKTGIKINPKNWSFTKNRVKTSSRNLENLEINSTLDYFENLVKKEFQKFFNENKRVPETYEIKSIVETNFFNIDSDEEIPRDFFGYWNFYIKNLSKSTNHKTGLPISKGTIQSYKNVLKRFKEFEKYKKKLITFDSIDMNFYYNLVDYLESKELSRNTVGKYIKILKSILNSATENGVNNNLKFRSKHFKVQKEETTSIYLTFEELKLIIDLDLSNDLKLKKARDLFIVLCYTGQRYQSLKIILDKNNRDKNFIRLKQNKGNNRLVIPILPEIRQYLDYLKPSDVLSNSQLNLYIKEVCSMIPQLHTKVTNEKTKGGKKIEKLEEKYKLVGTHTGRRSFATNFYISGIFPVYQIMAITGHKKEHTFFKYIRTTSEEHAKRFLETFNKGK